jgi:hypothetical protein
VKLARAAALVAAVAWALSLYTTTAGQERRIGRETAVTNHLKDGDELRLSTAALIAH